jgi:hypothetical protein
VEASSQGVEHLAAYNWFQQKEVSIHMMVSQQLAAHQVFDAMKSWLQAALVF